MDFKLERTDGTPADPPTYRTGVYAWRPDIRSSADRSRWPLSWTSDAPLLQRVASRKLETRGAVERLIDRRRGEVEKIGPGQWLVDGELVTATTERHNDFELSMADQRPTGRWRHGPRGRVLSVR